MIKGEGNLSFFYFPVQKIAFFCTEQLIHLYKRKQSFVQDSNKYCWTFYYSRFIDQFYQSENTN